MKILMGIFKGFIGAIFGFGAFLIGIWILYHHHTDT